MSKSGMLSHLKVVELADTLGAYSGRILAELGAQVTKIEPPQGDPGRRIGPFAKGADDAGLPWLAWNLGKTGLRLDLTESQGLAELQALIDTADILIQGGDDHLADLGLTYAHLAKRNPGLISVIVAPFSETGALDGAPASDLTLMAMSGIMNMVGDPERAPLKLPGEQAYALGGIQGVTAALTALYARAHNDGKGERVWVSAYQSAVLAGYRDPIVWEWTGRIGQRTGNKLVRGKSGVRQIWPTRDGHVTWSMVDNPGMLNGMTTLMKADGAAGTLADVVWENTLMADAPQEQIEAWEEQVAAWLLTKSKHDMARLSGEMGLGLSKIDTPQEALASEHWAARGFWQRLSDPARGLEVPVPGPLFRNVFEPAPPSPAPKA